MAERKSERLMNLIFLLLSTRQFLTKEQVRAAIDDYRASSDDAFNRMFERDKGELRDLGIPLEIGSFDPLHEDMQGYRIPRDAAELPDLELTAEESAVIGLAAQVWEHAGLAGQSGDALIKLKAAGVAIDTSAVPLAQPRITAGEPAFDAVWDAVRAHQPIRFPYGRTGEDPVQRHLQPWGVLSWRGRWYVGGHDVDRGEPRLFRVSRIRGDVTPAGPADSYTVPPDTSVRDLAASFTVNDPVGEAVLHVRRDRALPLRRHALSVTELDDDLDEVVVGYRSTWELASTAASFAPHVLVVSPPEARAMAVDVLRASVEANA
ncbi:YafY family protein [Aeromicrobium sp. Leaf350]|uniref:helix-turn-helix transcriptional regulator n=1 Tax=Aeromicrobium sp. Leaf350 TaxID=2876565 RepID=UPI001E3DEB53|nr:WYL domain-containing protein [Aeromicrobium sp. Leaf350]